MTVSTYHMQKSENLDPALWRGRDVPQLTSGMAGEVIPTSISRSGRMLCWIS